jgi:transcription elongation factor Elf1
MNFPITLGCYKCGSQDISIPSRSKDAIVTCNSCHAGLGKWGAIRVAALANLKLVVKEYLNHF